MSQAQMEITEPRLLKPRLTGWLEQIGDYLSIPSTTLKNRHFWVIIALVLLVAAAHTIVEAGTFFHSAWGLLYFVPTSVFLVPVAYAAIIFGLKGALATALLATVTAIPNWVFFHDGLGRFGCIFQVSIVDVTAYFVGHRVDRERHAWRQAEAATTAKKASELKYRSLLLSSPIAILVVNPAGTVVEANEAARILFGRNTASLEGIHLADLVGKMNAQRLLRVSQDGGKPDSMTLKLKGGPSLHIEPRVSKTHLDEGQSVTQILLRDASEEQRRQAGLKAYTAYVIKALEEERSRIARELHDDTIQGLIMVCRQLNNVEASEQSLPWSATSNLREAYKAVEEVIIGLRDFTRELRPPTLDDLGIITSVRRLLSDLSERSRIEGRFKLVGTERRLSPDQELTLFRVTQEALRNVEHHARASRVFVTMTFSRNESRLDVIDNGIGFSTSSVSGDFAPTGHLGLISMQERIESVGGRLEIQSNPGKGTRVSACIPTADATIDTDNSSDVSNSDISNLSDHPPI